MGKNWLTTMGAVITSMAGIPVAVGEYSKLSGHSIVMADWFYVFCIACGVIGPMMIGTFAKDYNTHPTISQVELSSAQQQLDAAKVIANSPIAPMHIEVDKIADVAQIPANDTPIKKE